MTRIKLHGLLADEFGDCFSMEIENPKDTIDAIDANRSGFKKRVVELHNSGFDYALLIDKKKIQSIEDVETKRNFKQIDLVPVLGGAGPEQIIFFIITTALSIALAPDPPKPPEITQQAASLEKSFTFSSTVNRAAQGTPVPVGYGELIVGSEVIQSCIKSYPQNQKSLDAFRRNPFDFNENISTSSSQEV